MTVSDIVLVWIAIILEALPFVAIGSALSALVGHFLSDDVLARIAPRSPFLGVLLASVAGVAIPTCDCATFPVVRRLLDKGLPPAMAASFLCAAPLVGPVVALATLWAYPGDPAMAVARIVSGLVAGWTAGVLVHRFHGRGSPLRTRMRMMGDESCDHGSSCGCHARGRFRNRLLDIAHSASSELAENMAFVIAGSLVAACLRSVIPVGALGSMPGGEPVSLAAAMALGFGFCLCANADAFVARALAGVLSPGAQLSFMVLGGMLDLKNLLLFGSSFRRRFVLLVAGAAVFVALAAGLLLDLAVRP